MVGTLFNIQRFSLHDGPGIRTTVFFKGCNLSCAWCHNPESLTFVKQLAINTVKCTYCGKCAEVCTHQVHHIEPSVPNHRLATFLCTDCGECSKACPNDAITSIGTEYTVEQVMTDAATVLTRNDVMEGVPEMINLLQVEAVFTDGSRLLSIHSPIK